MKKPKGYIILVGITSAIFLAVISLSIISISAADLNTQWDWSGVIGTGQSLSVGAQANPAVSTTQPFNNLKLSLGSLVVPPFDAASSQLSMTAMVEPIRSYATTYPGPYPGNIYGETPHTSMANQITKLVKDVSGNDYVTVHTVVGESGQGMSEIKKGAVDNGSTGRAYAASMFEVEAINNLAKKVGKTYGVGAVILTHGETDCGNAEYESQMATMWSDYNQDVKNITGQSQDIKLITTQQHSVPTSGTATGIQAQWQVGVNNSGKVICAGPNYYYNYDSDGVHLNADGYKLLGEKYGKVYYETVVLGNDWQPLQPESAKSSGNTITVDLHVPVGPLVWDTNLQEPNQSVNEWKNGKGFEVVNTYGNKVTINSVQISGNSVIITCASSIEAGTQVGYAFTAQTKRTNGTVRWGLLRDSDPFVGYNTNVVQPNYCVSFQIPVTTGTSTPTPVITTNTPVITTATATPTPVVTIQTQTPVVTTPVVTTPSTTNGSNDGVSVEVTVMNDWGAGGLAKFVVTNNGTTATNGWSVKIVPPGTITNIWGGEASGTGEVTITSKDWNGVIQPGGTAEGGFIFSY